jgi:hypothetical protein
MFVYLPRYFHRNDFVGPSSPKYLVDLSTFDSFCF